MTDTKDAPEASSDELHLKIVEALEDPRYEARTIEGIEKQIGVPKIEILHAISSDKGLSSKVRIYPRRAKGGKLLLTTRDKFVLNAPALDKFIDLFGSKTGGTLDDIL